MYDIFEKLKSLNTAPTVTGTPEFLVVGLGNPEPKYDTTRHNAGFMAIDHIAQKTGCKVNQLKFKSLCGMCEIEGKKVMLIKPTTYMNSSGEAVREAAAFYKIPPEKTIIIFDDISLDVGKMRIRRKGSDGGHNGIKSIIAHIGTQTFDRIRVGIDKDPRIPTVNWVLGKIRKEDMDAYLESVNEAAKAAVFSVTHDFTETMNQFNKKQVKE